MTFFTSLANILRALLYPLVNCENSYSNFVPYYECSYISGSLSHICSSNVSTVFSLTLNSTPCIFGDVWICMFPSTSSQFCELERWLVMTIKEERGVDGLDYYCYLLVCKVESLSEWFRCSLMLRKPIYEFWFS